MYETGEKATKHYRKKGYHLIHPELTTVHSQAKFDDFIGRNQISKVISKKQLMLAYS